MDFLGTSLLLRSVIDGRGGADSFRGWSASPWLVCISADLLKSTRYVLGNGRGTLRPIVPRLDPRCIEFQLPYRPVKHPMHQNGPQVA